jgi:hypothetical protein
MRSTSEFYVACFYKTTNVVNTPRRIAAYDDQLPPSDMMSDSASARSTPSVDVPSHCSKSPGPSPSQDDLFNPDSNYSDSTYIPPNSSGRVSPIDMSDIHMI